MRDWREAAAAAGRQVLGGHACWDARMLLLRSQEKTPLHSPAPDTCDRLAADIKVDKPAGSMTR